MRFRLIVGLGNPTTRYEQTRHNAGFWLVDELAERYRLRFAQDSRSQGLMAKLDWEGENVFLLKPMQYMNRSGGAVAVVANFYKIEPSQVLVAHDELDFAAGTVKLKLGGGHGGHNGLRDIVTKLGSADFARIRLGIGHPGDRNEVVNYVLDRPSRHEGELLRDAIDRVADQFQSILSGRLELAMNALHG
ncbi:MAG: aminoacyl-tRNA hydrolase [Methylococcaceae bacterium]|nr:aminoacyl-tRNA hydrolase [Methylococcaceae bacterium]